MDDDKAQLIGLIGFILAGLIFAVVGVRADDPLTVIGSLIWTASCLVWMIPIVTRDRTGS